MGIIIKTDAEIAIMREAGRITATVLEILTSSVKPGMRTDELDAIAEKEPRRFGAIPSFKGYRGYPASLCVSVNDEIVHGIPDKRILLEGDIVSIDYGVIYKGFQGDAARTVAVGKVNARGSEINGSNGGVVKSRH